MKITAITKFKHGAIWEAMKKLNWSQNELAKRTGVHPSVIGSVVNMKTRPTEDVAQRIQNAFAEAGDYYDILEWFPETFKGFGTTILIEQTEDIDVLKLEAHQEFYRRLQLNTLTEDADFIRQLFSKLDGNEQLVLEARYDKENPKGYKEIAKQLNIKLDSVYNCESRALRKIKRVFECSEKLEELL